MRCNADIVYDTIKDYFDITDNELECRNHMGSMYPKRYRACWAYVLVYGLGYTRADACKELVYANSNSLHHPIGRIVGGHYDYKPPFNDSTALRHCENIMVYLSSKYNNVASSRIQYGHQPHD